MSTKLIKTIISLVLAITVIVALPFGTVAGALDDGRSGVCGENLTWKLDKKGLLTISGKGEMDSYADSDIAPWGLSFADDVKSIVIKEGVTSLGNEAFFSLANLSEVTLPSTLKKIGDNAFTDCGKLGDVSLGDALTSIGAGAFSHCSELKEFNIPASVESIGELAFVGCSNLEKITVDEKNSKYCDVDGVLFNKSETELICCPAKISGVYKVPSKTTIIDTRAFEACYELTRVILPYSLRTIGDGAFGWCKKLESIVIPNSVMSIGEGAFAYNKGLKVFGYKDSAIEAYATENKIAFEALATTADNKAAAFYNDGRNIIEGAELVITADDNVVAPESVAGADIYDISLTRNGKSVFLVAPMIICVPIENEVQPLPGATVGYEVYRLTDGGKTKKTEATVEGRYLVFEASSEGRYAVLPVMIAEDGTSHSAVETKIMTGDVNGDKSITLEDVVAIQRHIAKLEKLASVDKYNADADKDGYVSMNDVVTIQRHIAKLISF
ncbi:MAG: leucine-rich repeat protein [Clostridiales bacterium]|nr:leucine-rich repeat protein [Clostridiales bacterium]